MSGFFEELPLSGVYSGDKEGAFSKWSFGYDNQYNIKNEFHLKNDVNWKKLRKFSDFDSSQRYFVHLWDSFGVQNIIIFGLRCSENFSGIVLHYTVGLVAGVGIESFQENGYEILNIEKSPSFILRLQNFELKYLFPYTHMIYT